MTQALTPAAKALTDVEKDTDLPRALVKKIVKNKVNQTLAAAAPGEPLKDIQINKDALIAFSESAKVFISYLTSAANDICKEAKRQTISAEDVFTALQDLDFGELITPTKEALDAYRQESKEKNKRKAEQVKKRKAEEAERQHVHDAKDRGAYEEAPIHTQHSDAAAPEVQGAVQEQPFQQPHAAPYISQPHPAYSEPQKLPQPTSQFQQSAGLPLQQQGAAYLGQANPFAPAFAQQASQIAAALAQAQAAQAQAAQVSQLLPGHFAPTQLQQPNFPQFPGAQAGAFTVPRHLNQQDYAQFAAVLAQQAARQRQAQEAQLAQQQQQQAQFAQQGRLSQQQAAQAQAQAQEALAEAQQEHLQQQQLQQPHPDQPPQPPAEAQGSGAVNTGSAAARPEAPTEQSGAGSNRPAAFQ